MTTPFRISDAVFIESAYISGEAKLSISTAEGNGRALGPQNVEAIVGLPGGMFVKHRGAWNFCPWANVKSARLIDVPADILATAEGDLPVRRVTPEDVREAVATVKAAVEPAKYEPPIHERTGTRRARKPVDVQVVSAATEPPSTVTTSPVPVVPAPLPERDEMGVLKSLQPTSGPTIECAACGTKFIQGANHVCKRVDDLV